MRPLYIFGSLVLIFVALVILRILFPVDSKRDRQ